MPSRNFFQIKADIKRPTQSQIEIVRRRALANISHGRRKEKLDAKSVESLLRIVSGKYSDLHSSLESEYRKTDYKLDAKYAQGIKEAKSMLIKIEQDVHHLESMGYDRKSSGIDYTETVLRLRTLSQRQNLKKTEQTKITNNVNARPQAGLTRRNNIGGEVK